MTVLLVGGDADPHIKWLLSAVEQFGASAICLLVGKDANPALTWRLDTDELLLNGELTSPEAIFIRFDVFTNLKDRSAHSAYRAHAWFSTLCGWILAHPQVRVLNRKSFAVQTNKAAVLWAAKECGLEIPATVITNDIGQFNTTDRHAKLVVKPVIGGDYCRSLDEVTAITESLAGIAAAPAIVQAELVSPDVRIYFVDGSIQAFRILSQSLDYRVDASCSIEHLRRAPGDVVPGLQILLDRLQVNFAAADFKTSRESSRLIFLEVNTGPMFCGFDIHADGVIGQSIARFLCDRPSAA